MVSCPGQLNMARNMLGLNCTLFRCSLLVTGWVSDKCLSIVSFWKKFVNVFQVGSKFRCKFEILGKCCVFSKDFGLLFVCNWETGFQVQIICVLSLSVAVCSGSSNHHKLPVVIIWVWHPYFCVFIGYCPSWSLGCTHRPMTHHQWCQGLVQHCPTKVDLSQPSVSCHPSIDILGTNLAHMTHFKILAQNLVNWAKDSSVSWLNWGAVIHLSAM